MLETLKVTETILTLADVAKRLEVSRQAVKNRLDRGTLPEPDYRTERGAPMWKLSTLEKVGIFSR